MNYINYEEYQEFGGELEEKDFKRMLFPAAKTIDYYTYNRIRKLKDIPNEVKACLFELIEYEYLLEEKGGVEIASETVDTHSITYAVNSRVEDLAKYNKKTIVREWLLHTGLMYRGVK